MALDFTGMKSLNRPYERQMRWGRLGRRIAGVWGFAWIATDPAHFWGLRLASLIAMLLVIWLISDERPRKEE